MMVEVRRFGNLIGSELSTSTPPYSSSYDTSGVKSIVYQQQQDLIKQQELDLLNQERQQSSLISFNNPPSQELIIVGGKQVLQQREVINVPLVTEIHDQPIREIHEQPIHRTVYMEPEVRRVSREVPSLGVGGVSFIRQMESAPLEVPKHWQQRQLPLQTTASSYPSSSMRLSPSYLNQDKYNMVMNSLSIPGGHLGMHAAIPQHSSFYSQLPLQQQQLQQQQELSPLEQRRRIFEEGKQKLENYWNIHQHTWQGPKKAPPVPPGPMPTTYKSMREQLQEQRANIPPPPTPGPMPSDYVMRRDRIQPFVQEKGKEEEVVKEKPSLQEQQEQEQQQEQQVEKKKKQAASIDDSSTSMKLKELLKDPYVHIVDDRENSLGTKTIQIENEKTGQRFLFESVDPQLQELKDKEKMESDHLPFVPREHK